MKILTATIFSMAVLLRMPAIVSAQVFDGNLILSTQAEIDAFNYTEVTGSLIIGNKIGFPPSDIKSLKPLSKLNRVGASLTIVYTDLSEDLQGLENLTSIGDSLMIESNTKLSSLQGLNNIAEIGGSLYLRYNFNLLSLQGLENLTTVKGHLLISNNISLTSMEGLENLSSVKEFTIYQNDQLQNLQGLENLSSIIKLSITMNDQLQNLNGLENLTMIDQRLSIGFNSSLVSLKGLKNIKSLGSLSIWSNDALENLQGIENLSTIREDLQIRGNDALESLQGLENLQSLGSMFIIDNPNLNDCCAIADLVGKVEGEIDISQNGPNCNSGDVIEENCLPIISSFTLVNTTTDQDIADLVMEDNLAVINTLETGIRLNIRANTLPEMAGSVVFALDGNITRTENVKPYALFGDHPTGNYLYQKLALGRHTLTATPYEGKNATGKQGTPLSIELFITNQPLAVTSFTLISTVDNTDQFELTEGSVIPLESGNRLNIRANTFGEVKSIVFDFLETNNFRTENVPPFSLGGDHPVGEYFNMPELKTPGVYKLTATPYSLANGQGTAGMPLSITFSVSGPSATDDHGVDFIETKAKKLSEKLNLMEIRLFPNPAKGMLQVQVTNQGDNKYPLSLQLYNQWGVKMWEGRGEVNHTARIDVSHLSAGLYFLKTTGNGYSHTQRLFVE